jgi:hypothetical protein
VIIVREEEEEEPEEEDEGGAPSEFGVLLDFPLATRAQP